MRIVVVCAGAVGTLLGDSLAAAGHTVTYVRRAEGPTPVERIADGPELAVLAVRMPDLAGALAVAAAWPQATVLAVQNGVGADDVIVTARPIGGLIAGSLTAAVSLEGGVAQRRSRGGIGLALVHGNAGAMVERLVVDFRRGDLRARRYPDARVMRWSKLLANLLANATCAILDMEPAAIYTDAGSFRVELRQLREALAVMGRLGVRPVALPGADVRPLALAARLPTILVQPFLRRAIARGRGGKVPSLQAHLASGSGPSEVDWLNGAVAHAAAGVGLTAPVNAALADLVRQCTKDPERRAWFRGRPDRLVEAVSAP